MDKREPITYGTVRHLAKEAGWVAPQNENKTDVGNGKRLVRYYGEDLRYVPEIGKWIFYENNRWKWDNAGQIYRYAKAATDLMVQDAINIEDGEQKQKLVKHAFSSENSSRIKAMIEMASKEKDVVLHQSEIDSNPDLLGVANGVLDLKTGRVRPEKREDYITKHNNIIFPEGDQHEQI